MESPVPGARRPVVATLVRLIRPLYLPSFLTTVGVGMLIPVLPIYLREIAEVIDRQLVLGNWTQADAAKVAGVDREFQVLARIGILVVHRQDTDSIGSSLRSLSAGAAGTSMTAPYYRDRTTPAPLARQTRCLPAPLMPPPIPGQVCRPVP